MCMQLSCTCTCTCTTLLLLRDPGGAGAKGRSKEKSKKLLQKERDLCRSKDDSHQDSDDRSVARHHVEKGDKNNNSFHVDHDVKIDQPASQRLQQVKRGVRRRSSVVMIQMVESHLGRREPRVGMPEPPPPSGSGLHQRIVNTVDGSVRWVRVSTKVPVGL